MESVLYLQTLQRLITNLHKDSEKLLNDENLLAISYTVRPCAPSTSVPTQEQFIPLLAATPKTTPKLPSNEHESHVNPADVKNYFQSFLANFVTTCPISKNFSANLLSANANAYGKSAALDSLLMGVKENESLRFQAKTASDSHPSHNLSSPTEVPHRMLLEFHNALQSNAPPKLQTYDWVYAASRLLFELIAECFMNYAESMRLTLPNPGSMGGPTPALGETLVDCSALLQKQIPQAYLFNEFTGFQPFRKTSVDENVLLQEYCNLYRRHIQSSSLKSPLLRSIETVRSLKYLNHKRDMKFAVVLVRAIQNALKHQSITRFAFDKILRCLKLLLHSNKDVSHDFLYQFLLLLKKNRPLFYRKFCAGIRNAALAKSKAEGHTILSFLDKLLDPFPAIQKCYTRILLTCEKEQRQRIEQCWKAKAFLSDEQAVKNIAKKSATRELFALLQNSRWWSPISIFPAKVAVFFELYSTFVRSKTLALFNTLIDTIDQWEKGDISFTVLKSTMDRLIPDGKESVKCRLKEILEFEEYKVSFVSMAGLTKCTALAPNHITSYHPFLPLEAQNYTKWERSSGCSYRRLPLDMPYIATSGRKSWQLNIFNDTWVSIPENSESYPKCLNIHEAGLFKIEDERYSVDMQIGRITSLLRFLYEAKRQFFEIWSYLDLSLKKPFTLKHFSYIHKSALQDAFGNHVKEVERRLFDSPREYIPALITYLETKLQAWYKRRRVLDLHVWRRNEQLHWEGASLGLLTVQPMENTRRYNTRSSKAPISQMHCLNSEELSH